MPWRTPHGQAAKGGALTVLESLPADELPPATPLDTVQPQRDGHGKFIRGNTVQRRSRPRFVRKMETVNSGRG